MKRLQCLITLACILAASVSKAGEKPTGDATTNVKKSAKKPIPDYTQGEPSTCEVHHIAMFKRAVPFAHGMIPMNRAMDTSGEWKRRMDHYPHPGDCQPATGIVLPGEAGRVIVYVCKKCETAMKETKKQKP